MPLRYLVYTSRALIDMESADHTLLYFQARNRNAKYGITGYLHREGNTFAQYIEGAETMLRNLYDRIRIDPRHRTVRLMRHGEIAARRFETWDMAFTPTNLAPYAHFARRKAIEPRIERARGDELLMFMEEMARRNLPSAV